MASCTVTWQPPIQSALALRHGFTFLPKTIFFKGFYIILLYFPGLFLITKYQQWQDVFFLLKTALLHENYPIHQGKEKKNYNVHVTYAGPTGNRSKSTSQHQHASYWTVKTNLLQFPASLAAHPKSGQRFSSACIFQTLIVTA